MADTVLAFDVYGTLIDTAGVARTLRGLVGDKTPAVTELWRAKQLEYSFRRGLMQNYQDFSVCTRQALDYCCDQFQISLNPDQKKRLLHAYRRLPAFPDVATGLEELARGDARMYAFSNGRADDVRNLLAQAKIEHYFTDVVSCDEIKSFKPNPAVYAHFMRRSAAAGSRCWLVSSNSFDVIGALSAGMQAAWLVRSQGAIFDPWEMEPTLRISSLDELPPALMA